MIAPNDDRWLVEMIQAAGDYVQPSRDLRPAVVEAAQASTQQAHTHGALIAGAAVATVVFLAGLLLPTSSPARQPQVQTHEALSQESVLPVAKSASGPWRLVDAFTSLRAEQAEVLNPQTEPGDSNK